MKVKGTNVYLTEEEKRIIKAKAEARNLTFSNYVRLKLGLIPANRGAPPGNKNAKRKTQN